MQENIGKKFAKYVSLNVIGMLTASAMVFIDAIFISIALGADGLTAISLTGPVWAIVFGLGLLLGEGGGSKYAANMAAEKGDKANAFFTVAIKTGFIIAVPLLITGIFLSEQLSALLGAQGHILPMVTEYTRVMLIFSPVIMMYYAMESFVRNDQTPSIAMFSSVILYAANILFDYIFILRFNLGMLGSAMATSVAAVLSLGYLLLYWRKKARFRFAPVFAALKKTKAVFAIGAPSFINNVVGGLSTLTFNLLFLRHLGNIGVAAFGIVSTLSVLVFATFLGIAQGMQPLASHCYGKGDNKNLAKVFKLSITTSLGVALLFIAVAFLFTHNLTAILNQEQDTILAAQLTELAVTGTRIYFAAFAFVGITMISTYFLAATGAPKYALVLSVLQSGGIIPVMIALAYFAGVLGIWASYPAFEMTLAVLSIVLVVKASKFRKSFAEK